MKLKNKLKFIILMMVVVIINYSFSGSKIYCQTNYNFNKNFNNLKIKSKIKILKTFKGSDEFSLNLKKCQPNFYIGFKGCETYYLNDNKSINKIIVTEYIFKDSISAVNSYENAYKYSEYRRNLSRKDYGKLCFAFPESQVYYCVRKGLHIYLLSMEYNFIYNTAYESVETNIKKNEEILLDDLYYELEKNKAKNMDKH